MAEPRYERLSAVDAALLRLEEHNAHMHVGAVAIFAAAPLRNADGALDIDDNHDQGLSGLDAVIFAIGRSADLEPLRLDLAGVEITDDANALRRLIDVRVAGVEKRSANAVVESAFPGPTVARRDRPCLVDGEIERPIGVVDRQRGLRQIRHLGILGQIQSIDIFFAFDQDHCFGRFAHRANNLVVTLVSD